MAPPFPGPGLGIRIVGEVTAERLDVLRAADAIAREEMTAAGLDREIWQCPVVLLADVRSVGVQGDGRTYGHPWCCAPSQRGRDDGGLVAAPYDVLARISTRITNEVREVNRVVLDVTSKPPGRSNGSSRPAQLNSAAISARAVNDAAAIQIQVGSRSTIIIRHPATTELSTM